MSAIAIVSACPMGDGTTLWRGEFLRRRLVAAGFDVELHTYEESAEALLGVIESAKKVIFIRPRVRELTLKLLECCRRLKRSVALDLDDAIFPEFAAYNGAFLSGTSPLKSVERSNCLFAENLAFVELAIASTLPIAKYVEGHYGVKTVISPNVLPEEFCEPKSDAPKCSFRLLYASGSRTHEYDLATVLPALMGFLRRHDDVSLSVMGDSVEQNTFAWAADHVQMIGRRDFTGMLEVFGDHDLLLVPLARNVFNDAKSNIKYIEAGARGTPVLAAACEQFRAAIRDGDNGFLYEQDFAEKLESIYAERELLSRIGEAAFADVKAHHVAPGVELPRELVTWLRDS